MGVILDSSEIITLERNRGVVESLVAGREEEPFGISVVTVAELLHGVERADTETRKIRRQAFVEKVGDFIWERDQAHLVTASAGELGRFANKPWYRLHNFHPSRGRDWWTRVYDEVLLPARNARLPMVSDEPMGSRGPDDLERGYPGRDGNPAHHRMNFWVTV
ncbi:MAG: hypothetical protein HYV06_09265, partial [Deltaproteobacteria bacterium]|nr:hypothetical protein [Deltaproteobacteria bacterium]